MVLDTGASSVVLTRDDAQSGRPAARSAGPTTSHIDTANGRARAAAVTLDRVGIGGLGRAFRLRAGGAAGPAQNQPARHELPQPAAKLGGPRRSLGAARLSVRRLSLQNRLTRNRSATSSRKQPNAISSVRRGSRVREAVPRRAPTKLETGAVTASPDQRHEAEGRRWQLAPGAAGLRAMPADGAGNRDRHRLIPDDVATALWIGLP